MTVETQRTTCRANHWKWLNQVPAEVRLSRDSLELADRI